MEEKWKDIKDYEGLYQVSNCGRIKSLINNNFKYKHKKEIILKQYLRTGYMNVILYDFNGKPKTKRVNRLVAQTFIPNTENKPTVNHKDENKLNNCVDNLEWATMQEQNIYGTRIERIKNKLYKKVIQFDEQGNQIKIWNSILEAENTLKIAKGKITCCCQKQYGRKTAGGYRWEYANE